MSFLYQEASPDTRAQLQSHLDACSECQATVAAWKHTQSQLDLWDFTAPSRHPRHRRFTPWTATAAAAAAAVFLSAGFAAGRITSVLRPDTANQAALQSQIAHAVDAAVTARLQTAPAEQTDPGTAKTNDGFLHAQATQSEQCLTRASTACAELIRQTLSALDQALLLRLTRERDLTRAEIEASDRRHQVALAAVRRDLRTVALFANARLDATQDQIGQLAAWRQTDTHDELSSPSSTNPEIPQYDK
jgi:hypothetical protein